MGKSFGKCALCGKECEMSFEHIPPRAAFNNRPTKMYTGEKLLADGNRMPWDVQGLQYLNRQRGSGLFSLCEHCNNLTGAWYGDTYQEMAQIVASTFRKWTDETNIGIGIRDVYGARFIKQVLSMFCSVNSFDALEPYRHPRAVADKGQHSPLFQTLIDAQMALVSATNLMDELRTFVLDRDAVGLDRRKFKVCMYLTRSPLLKLNGLSTVINIESNSFVTVSEITAYPFGFLLFVNPPEGIRYQGVDITPLADWGYNDKATIEFPLQIVEMNTYLPNDFRSKDEIVEGIRKAKEWTEKHDV